MDVDEFLAGAFLGQDGASDSDADERGSDDDASEDDDELGAAGSDSEDEEEEVGDDLTGGDEIEKEPESDSDDDDDSDGGDVGKQTRRLKDEVSSHRAQLEKLKEADPEFYEYLASTDRELLAFGEGESEEGSESEGEEGPESDEEQQDDEAGARGVEASPAALPEQTLTLVQVESWCRAAKETAALGALRNLLRAYRVACHYGDTEEQVDEGMRIGSSAVYNQLMLFVLKESDGIFREILGVDAAADAAAVGKAPRWRKAEPLVKSFLGNTLHLLGEFCMGTYP